MSITTFKSDLSDFMVRLDRAGAVDPAKRSEFQKEYNKICRVFTQLKQSGAFGREAATVQDQVKLAHRKVAELKAASAINIPTEGWIGATGAGAIAVSYVLPAGVYATLLGYGGVAILSGLAVKTIYDCYSRPSASTAVEPHKSELSHFSSERSEPRPLPRRDLDEEKAPSSPPLLAAQARFNATVSSSARNKARTGISERQSDELQQIFLNSKGDRRAFCIAIDDEIKGRRLRPEQGYHIVRQFDEAFGARSGFYSYIDGMRGRGEIATSSAYYVIRQYDVAMNRGTPLKLIAQLKNMVRAGHLTPSAASSIEKSVTPPVSGPATFDAAQWFKDYKAEGPKGKYGAQNRMLAQLYQETCAAWDSGFMVGGRLVQLDPTLRNQTRSKSEKVSLASMPEAHTVPAKFSARSIVDQRPATAVAHDMVQRGLKPLVLDMANQFSHGGGVLGGARAQEETLCRQSNLMEGLLSIPFPLGEFEGVYVPQVQFFRADGNYEFKDPFAVDVIAIAAYNRAHGQGPNPWNPAYGRGNKNKIRLLLRTALSKGNDSLVLGALGCGAFGNDPKVIARYFKEVLEEREFAGKFREVRFAIIPDHNDPRNTNVTEFARVFP